MCFLLVNVNVFELNLYKVVAPVEACIAGLVMFRVAKEKEVCRRHTSSMY